MSRRALTMTAILVAGIAAFPALGADSGGAEPGGMLVITDRDCDAFRPYVQDPSVEYKPGADVHGDAVAPADLDSGLQVSPNVSFPVTVDIRPWTNLNGQTPQGTGSTPPPYTLGTGTEASVGTVSVQDGKVFFNGQQLSSPYENAVAQACLNYLKRGHDRDHGDHHDDHDRH